MSTIDYSEDEMVPIDLLAIVADQQAVELWGGNTGRGEPIPLCDAKGIYAYVFPYILNAGQFPENDEIVSKIRSINIPLKHASDDRVPDRVLELRQYGERFGSICVSARYTDSPVLWMSHFLPPYYFVVDAAKEEAKRQLKTDASQSKYYFFSPEEQYLEFKSNAGTTVLVNAVTPSRKIENNVVRPRAAKVKSEQLMSQIRRAWSRHIGRVPAMRAAPVGVSPDELSITHTEKRILYWECMPKVDHTSKNWCVPSSWAMLLGFYDNCGKGYKILGYGRLIDYWYEFSPGTHNLPNLIDELIPPKAADKINNYSFPEKIVVGDLSSQWTALVNEVDAGRPCFFNTIGHCTTALGYYVNSNGEQFAIVYTAPNPSTPTFEKKYNITECTHVGTVTLSGGTLGEDLLIIEPKADKTLYESTPNEITWFVWGNTIKQSTLSLSYDGGNTWKTIVSNLPAVDGFNAYAWISEKSGTRVRARVEGFNAANELVAADGSEGNLEVKTPKSGSGWKKIWGPTSSVLVSSVVGLTGVTVIYAVPLSGDGIYRYDGKPMAWTKIGGPGKMFALNDYGFLYGLSPDGSGVYSYDGTPGKWTQIGGPAGTILAGGSYVFATNPQTGDVYRYGGKPLTWTKVGGPGKMFAADSKGRLYGISPDGSGIYRFDGTPMKWTMIKNTPTSTLYAGGSALYATESSGGDLLHYSLTPLHWNLVGGPGKMFAVDDTGKVFGLSPDGSGVFRYKGSWNNLKNWMVVGGAAGKIFAGGEGRLLATNPQNDDLMSYE